MKKGLLTLLILLAVVGIAFAQKTAYVGFVDSEGNMITIADVTWTAERPANWPGDILTELNPGGSVVIENLYGAGFSALQVQCEGFANPWAAGDVVVIHIIETSSGDYLDISIILTGPSADYWDPITYTPITMTAGGPTPTVPLATTLVAPLDAAIDVAVDGILEWNASVDATGYKLYFGIDNPPMTMVVDQAELTFDPTVNFGEMYYWQVVPYNAVGDAIANPVWSFTTVAYVADVNGADISGDDIPEDLPTPTVDTTGDGTGSTIVPTFGIEYSINVNGAVTVTITLNHPVLANGVIEALGLGAVPGAVWDYANGTVTFTWTFTPGKSTTVFVLGTTDPVLAVEFATFAAATMSIDGDVAVELTWTTASEANLSNFNVYRSYSSTFDNDASILPPVSPTNSSTGSTYNTIDKEVEVNETYYYWIEGVDIDGSVKMHGPADITIDANDTNVIARTLIGNAYPNPFVGSTRIDIDVKSDEVASVTVYNILGQAVKSFTKTGNTHIDWDGTNTNGKNCGSGIYFYRLTSPSNTVTKKVVIVK